MATKSHILAEIRRTAAENGGSPLGVARFQRATGIKISDWDGKYWIRWGDALQEAGFAPMNGKEPTPTMKCSNRSRLSAANSVIFPKDVN